MLNYRICNHHYKMTVYNWSQFSTCHDLFICTTHVSRFAHLWMKAMRRSCRRMLVFWYGRAVDTSSWRRYNAIYIFRVKDSPKGWTLCWQEVDVYHNEMSTFDYNHGQWLWVLHWKVHVLQSTTVVVSVTSSFPCFFMISADVSIVRFLEINSILMSSTYPGVKRF